MPLNFNGTEITAANFNGTELDSVRINDTTVWFKPITYVLDKPALGVGPNFISPTLSPGLYELKVIGSNGGGSQSGGLGACVSAKLNITSNTTLYCYVGSDGNTGPNANPGTNGNPGKGGPSAGSGGGGSCSYISLSNDVWANQTISNLLIVAGGGGGGAMVSGRTGGSARDEAPNGSRAPNGGYGATQTSGGASSGTGSTSGGARYGGASTSGAAGGGGAGLYGGGGGQAAYGGGGGSSYINSILTEGSYTSFTLSGNNILSITRIG